MKKLILLLSLTLAFTTIVKAQKTEIWIVRNVINTISFADYRDPQKCKGNTNIKNSKSNLPFYKDKQFSTSNPISSCNINAYLTTSVSLVLIMPKPL